MKKVLCVIAALALVATASADVRMFVTGLNSGYGLTDPSIAFIPTHGMGTDSDSYVLAAAPPIDAPSGTALAPVIINQASDGEFAYIWFQFQGEPLNTKVNGLRVEIISEATGLPATGAFCYYLQDNRNNYVPPRCRWDNAGLSPPYPEFTNNPQTLVAVDSDGVRAESANQPWNLYAWQAGGTRTNPPVTGVTLMGAVNVAPGLFSIHLIDISYPSGSPPPYLDRVGYFQFIPEPAGLLLMALAGLLLRRR